MIKKYEKGTVRADWKNNLTGYKIDYSDLHGFSLFAFLQSPSEDEVKKMSMNADLVIYFDDMDGVAFFSFNFDGTGGSAAFAPSLLLDYPTFTVPQPLDSFPFTVYVIDSDKGELLERRTFSLSDKFSSFLAGWCKENEKLNLSYDRVKEISKKYFELLQMENSSRSVRVAYSSSEGLSNNYKVR